MNYEEVVMRIIGPIRPVGESNEDARRLRNIRDLTELVDRLLFNISDVSRCASRDEASMKAIGVHARDFLNAVRETDAPFDAGGEAK